jgi:hypothetical protein
VRIPDSIETDLGPFLSNCADFIRDALVEPGHRVFVHCMLGTSRSASLVLFYMMRELNYTLRNALKHIMHQRSPNPRAPYTHPNKGFMNQLIACEKELFGVASLTLDVYMSREFSSGKNVSYGPVAVPKPRERHDPQAHARRPADSSCAGCTDANK